MTPPPGEMRILSALCPGVRPIKGRGRTMSAGKACMAAGVVLAGMIAAAYSAWRSDWPLLGIFTCAGVTGCIIGVMVVLS